VFVIAVVAFVPLFVAFVGRCAVAGTIRIDMNRSAKTLVKTILFMLINTAGFLTIQRVQQSDRKLLPF